ncbi:protein FAM166B [Boleophthalmus pectinirostris]|uniref:protein FAM166B n=1 Tax=Boleophthalmus pectinirostris TaxID=150288 RepID=UPI0024312250|nr:protein FAM166B [Boleophthalmus pectinirostris]
MDTTYPPKISKVLLTPDPHYIPGYAGYCPQLKYNIGKSYGQLTSELLSSPEVNHSTRLMVSGVTHSSEAARTGIGRSISDCHVRKMIPGYTGFIPKCRSHFACSYGEMCRKAFTDFYQEQQKRSQQQSAKLPVIPNYSSHLSEVKSMCSSQQESQTITSTDSHQHCDHLQALSALHPHGKAIFMDDKNPHKYFISGFTGHVPKARFLIGKSYPITTNQALVQFGKQQRNEPFSQDTAEGQDSSTLPTLYHPNRAVVPSFTGHIPGYRFLYGHTFGQLSQNALEKSGSKRVAWGEC